MDRIELIQKLINKRNFENYLEIGVLGGHVFFQIRCKNKIAVDPEFKFNWKGKIGEIVKNVANLKNQYFETTSDSFFQNEAQAIYKEKKLDICLVDGMHEFRFALNDVENSLKYLADDGVIILHDCNPVSIEAECSFEEWKNRGFTGLWNGDTWKAITYLLHNRPDLDVLTVDTDHGLGIVTKAKNRRQNLKPLSFQEINSFNFETLESDRRNLLNLKDISEGIEILDL